MYMKVYWSWCNDDVIPIPIGYGYDPYDQFTYNELYTNHLRTMNADYKEYMENKGIR